MSSHRSGLGFLALASALFSSGCGDSGETPVDDSDDETNASTQTEGAIAMSNPVAGETLPAAAFRGLLSLDGSPAAGLEIGDSTLATLQASDATHALIVTAEMWCPPCQSTALQLGGGRLPEVEAARQAGGLVIELVLLNRAFAEPSDADLVSWADTYGLTIPVLAPADDATRTLFPRRECAYVVELDNAEVLWNGTCSLGSALSGLTELQTALGI